MYIAHGLAEHGHACIHHACLPEQDYRGAYMMQQHVTTVSKTDGSHACMSASRMHCMHDDAEKLYMHGSCWNNIRMHENTTAALFITCQEKESQQR